MTTKWRLLVAGTVAAVTVTVAGTSAAQLYYPVPYDPEYGPDHTSFTAGEVYLADKSQVGYINDNYAEVYWEDYQPSERGLLVDVHIGKGIDNEKPHITPRFYSADNARKFIASVKEKGLIKPGVELAPFRIFAGDEVEVLLSQTDSPEGIMAVLVDEFELHGSVANKLSSYAGINYNSPDSLDTVHGEIELLLYDLRYVMGISGDPIREMVDEFKVDFPRATAQLEIIINLADGKSVSAGEVKSLYSTTSRDALPALQAHIYDFDKVRENQEHTDRSMGITGLMQILRSHTKGIEILTERLEKGIKVRGGRSL